MENVRTVPVPLPVAPGDLVECVLLNLVRMRTQADLILTLILTARSKGETPRLSHDKRMNALAGFG